MLCSLSQSGSLLPSPRSYSLAVVQPRHTASSKVVHEITYSHICRLFEIAPHLRELFPFGQDPKGPQLRSHALNVMNTVGTAVGLLDQSDQLVPVLKQLGQTHASFQLTAKEYQVRPVVVNAFYWKSQLGIKWIKLFGILGWQHAKRLRSCLWDGWSTVELFMKWLIYYGVVYKMVDLLWSCL